VERFNIRKLNELEVRKQNQIEIRKENQIEIRKQNQIEIRKQNQIEVRKQNQIEIRNRFATLERLGDGEDINRAWKIIKENIKISAKDSLGMYELKQHKPWFHEECLRFLDQREHAMMQWLQDTK
jgi:uncharacterized FlaG/YvyC family protein